ncbi:MAG: Gfo/Idh/MocA family oxidoreductase [Clostridia bacterium]|nr:Gfo/Idh/MocA family oxidoreductase [Clostridia bacterium]
MIRIGIVGTASIAQRRMIPAILKHPAFQYAGASIATQQETGFSGTAKEFAPLWAKKQEKAAELSACFGGRTWESYRALLQDPAVDAVYVALPPALHKRWIREAILQGKHVLAEKPFTTRAQDAQELIALAREHQVALVENYGFPLHHQMRHIQEWIQAGAIGDIRLVRATFGFPHRDATDFRYQKALGGGALLDCGGYTLKAATEMLGGPLEVLSAEALFLPEHEVDMAGTVTLRSPTGRCAQLAYGMDHAYRCELEVWGNQGLITAPRIFTAPDGFEAPVYLTQGQHTEEYKASDDQFLRIVEKFADCIASPEARERSWAEIRTQSLLTEQVRVMAQIKGKD